MSDSPQTPRAKALEYGIDRPTNNQAVLVSSYDSTTETGTMWVRITKDDPATVKVYADVLSSVGTPPIAPTTTKTEVPQVGPNGEFVHTTFPVTGLANTAPFEPNKHLVYWGYDVHGTLTEGGDESVPFVAVPEVCIGTVLGTHCLWLSYAAPGSGPLATYGEHTNDSSPYIPFMVRVPDEAKTVAISASGDEWSHGPGLTSGAEGRMGHAHPLNPTWADEYKSLNGSNIQEDTETPPELGKLVGLRQYSSSTIATAEIKIGASSTVTLDVNGNGQPYMIRLGLHDGFEWSNNGGSITVTLTWSKTL